MSLRLTYKFHCDVCGKELIATNIKWIRGEYFFIPKDYHFCPRCTFKLERFIKKHRAKEARR